MEVEPSWWVFWGSAEVRNIALMILAPIGIGLAVWRSVVAQKQVKLAEAGQNIDRYQKGAAMLGDERMSVRQAGILGLLDLARKDWKGHGEVIAELLNSFIRDRSQEVRTEIKSTSDNDEVLEPEEGRWPPAPADCEAAIKAFSDCSEARIQHLQREPVDDDRTRGNFQWAYLAGTNFSSTHLRLADFSRANLGNTLLEGVNLWGADLSNAVLTNADLSDAELADVDFSGAKLNDAVLIGVDLTRASFIKADLRNALIFNSDLKGADFDGADLTNANVTKEQLESAKNVDPKWFKQFEKDE